MDGAILGTPAYTSPEQFRGELDQMGPASDVYALVVVTKGSNYQVVRGGAWDQTPFDSRSASRKGLKPDERGVNLGFRVARSIALPR